MFLGHEVTSQRQCALMTFKGKNRGYKLQELFYELSHDWRMRFSTRLKPSGWSKLVIMTHLAGLACELSVRSHAVPLM